MLFFNVKRGDTMPTYKEALLINEQYAIDNYKEDTGIKILLLHFSNMSSAELLLHMDEEMPQDVYEALLYGVDRYVIKNIPVQHITGSEYFFGYQFKVNNDVLIPRFETEELVANVLLQYDDVFANRVVEVVDIGTGSGCISLSIANNSEANVFATDISDKALIVAKKNAKYNSLKVNFLIHDILKNSLLLFDKKQVLFDYIISNPPYIRKKEAQMMQKNVLDFEPHIALFVEDDDALIFYEAIADFAKISLKNNGKIYLEINEYIADRTAEIFDKHFFSDVKIKNDIFDKKRFLVVTK